MSKMRAPFIKAFVVREDEKSLDRAMRERVKGMKGLYIKLLTDLMRGLPDRLMLLPGGYLAFIEVKGKGKKPTPIQISVMNKLSKLGFRTYVLDSRCKLDLIIRDYVGHNLPSR